MPSEPGVRQRSRALSTAWNIAPRRLLRAESGGGTDGEKRGDRERRKRERVFVSLHACPDVSRGVDQAGERRRYDTAYGWQHADRGAARIGRINGIFAPLSGRTPLVLAGDHRLHLPRRAGAARNTALRGLDMPCRMGEAEATGVPSGAGLGTAGCGREGGG